MSKPSAEYLRGIFALAREMERHVSRDVLAMALLKLGAPLVRFANYGFVTIDEETIAASRRGEDDDR